MPARYSPKEEIRCMACCALYGRVTSDPDGRKTLHRFGPVRIDPPRENQRFAWLVCNCGTETPIEATWLPKD